VERLRSSLPWHCILNPSILNIMSPRYTRSRKVLNDTNSNASTAKNTGRPRRAAAMPSQTIVERSDTDDRSSIKLTVKTAPEKLRQATASRATRGSGRTAARRQPIVEVDTSEPEEEEEDAEGDEDEEMPDADEEDEEGEDDDEEDAEGDEDEEMEDLTPIPPPKSKPPTSKPIPPQVKAKTVPLPPISSKLAAPESDDDLSSLDSPDEDGVDGLDDEEDELAGEEDAEGDDDIEDEEGLEGDDADAMSIESDGLGSILGDMDGDTPDPGRLTKRQRADHNPEELMALSNEAQKKKHLTAEEYAMRRAELARRRKNLSEKRNEEEKVCPRLLQRLMLTSSVGYHQSLTAQARTKTKEKNRWRT